MSFFPANQHHRAFTLIELLVATTVASLLLVLLVGMTSQTLSILQRNTETLSSKADGAAALNTLARDLNALLRTQTEQTVFEAIPNATYGTDLVLIVRPKDDINGHPRTLAYRIEERPILAGSSTEETALHRVNATSDTTFTSHLNQTNLAPLLADLATSDNSVLVPGIYRMEIRAWPDGAAQPIAGSFQINSHGRLEDGRRVSRLDISIDVISQKGLAQLQSGRPLNEVREQHSRKITRTVRILN